MNIVITDPMKARLHAFRLAVVLSAVILVSGCGQKTDIPLPATHETTGLFTPVPLMPDTTTLVLTDFFVHPVSIDSVRLDPSLGYRISSDALTMTLFPVRQPVPRISVMNIWIKGYHYSMILERTRKIWQHIAFDPGKKKYRKVEITGEMNNWVPSRNPLKEKDGIWQTDLLLYPGKYQYKLVVDGSWILDPSNPDSTGNNIGGMNSVLQVGSLTPPGMPYLFTGKAERKKIIVGTRNRVKDVFVFWQNFQLDTSFWKIDSTGIVIRIPLSAKKLERSFIRVWASNAVATSNEVLVPLRYGRVILDPSELTRNDQEAMIIYFLMVDRFKNGNIHNDAPVKDSTVSPKLNFQGGDLAGITDEVEAGYFKKLGVNTLWISPITANPPDAWPEYPPPHRKFTGYHGYWPITFTSIDKHFGTPEDLKKLVGETHSHNMSLLLDFVSNHVHKNSWVYREHPDWATQFILPGNRKNLRLWDEQRLTTWFDEFLPTLDLSKPEVYGMVTDSALFWISEYDIDGFRHDATKHIPEIYWRTLTRKIDSAVVFPENRSVFQIGETYGNRELISSYINPGMLDGQFDFDVYFTARSVFSQEHSSFRDLNYALQQSFSFYGEHSLMGYITGNQDQARFISLASGAISANEDDREAGWKRAVGVKDTIGYNRLRSMIAFITTIPGIPVIYYGDEFGMPGANDPDNRRMMRFDSLDPHEQKTLEFTEKLIHFRSESLPLIYGDFRTLQVSDDIYIYIRTYFDKYVVVIFNKSRIPKKIGFQLPGRFAGTKPACHFGNAFGMEQNEITMTLPGSSFEILSN
jgi:cyclomaltodextrinase